VPLFLRPFAPEIVGADFDAKEPKDQDTAKLPLHKPDAGPLLRLLTAPTKQAIVVIEINGVIESHNCSHGF